MNDITVKCTDVKLFELIYNELCRIGYTVGCDGECRLLITDDPSVGSPDRRFTIAVSRHPEELSDAADCVLRRPILMSELRDAVYELMTERSVSTSENEREVEFLSPGRVRYCGHEIELTETEYRLLGCLADRRGEAVERETINSLLGLSGNAADVYVCYLRKKLTVDERNPIATLRGQGYMLK